MVQGSHGHPLVPKNHQKKCVEIVKDKIGCFLNISNKKNSIYSFSISPRCTRKASFSFGSLMMKKLEKFSGRPDFLLESLFMLILSQSNIRLLAKLTGNPAEPGSPSLPGFPCREEEKKVLNGNVPVKEDTF